ncbi:MAG: zinc ribbon domain-containing protein [Anaerolineae bacterium]|jgi:RNA polymerase subunit RPABC4/transcription elongation factor Spt4|nr:zinc ribbon domain-containing protein [Anaerolineae bacterium]
MTDLINNLIAIAQILLAVLSGFFVAFTLSLVIWTYRDIRSRSRDVFAHILAALIVLLFNVPGLVIYLILRPKETLAEAYERALEEEALLQDIEEKQACPGCKQPVQPDYMVCPNCHTKLRKPCVHCGRLLHPKWNICPYCGTSQVAPPIPVPVAEQASPDDTQ